MVGITRRVLALYTYLYQSLATALLEQNPEPLSRIAELLDYERETWRQVCEQLAQGSGTPSAPVERLTHWHMGAAAASCQAKHMHPDSYAVLPV